jgi:hypothetical protein
MTHDKVGDISAHRVYVAWKSKAVAAADEVPASRVKAVPRAHDGSRPEAPVAAAP